MILTPLHCIPYCLYAAPLSMSIEVFFNYSHPSLIALDRSSFNGNHYLLVGGHDGVYCFECAQSDDSDPNGSVQVTEMIDHILLDEFQNLKSPYVVSLIFFCFVESVISHRIGPMIQSLEYRFIFNEGGR